MWTIFIYKFLLLIIKWIILRDPPFPKWIHNDILFTFNWTKIRNIPSKKVLNPDNVLLCFYCIYWKNHFSFRKTNLWCGCNQSISWGFRIFFIEFCHLNFRCQVLEHKKFTIWLFFIYKFFFLIFGLGELKMAMIDFFFHFLRSSWTTHFVFLIVQKIIDFVRSQNYH